VVDYESDKASYWKNCDVWTLSEVQFLLDGQWPDKGKEPPSSLTMHLVESKKEIVHDMGNGHILVAEERELHVFHPVPDGVTLIQLVEEAIAAGRLSPLKSHETPKYKRQFEVRFRPSEVIAWATSRRCFPDFVFSQASNCASPNAPVVESDFTVKIDFNLLATREQLIAAFGPFTGMDTGWFNNLKDSPALRAARKVTGQGGRGHIAAPLFCPFAVMQWLADPTRRKGRKLGEDKAWQMLEQHFPSVYSANSVCDPRTD